MSETSDPNQEGQIAEYLEEILRCRHVVECGAVKLGPVFMADAPWRIEPGDDSIPLTIIARDAEGGKIDSIAVYYKKEGTPSGGSSIIWQKVGEFPGPGTIEQKFWCVKNLKIARPAGFKNGDIVASSSSGKPLRLKVEYWREKSAFHEQHLEVFLAREHLPARTSPKWCYGDTHYHSRYTNNVNEFGNPVDDTKNAARCIGLEWLIITDHSVDLSKENPYWKGERTDHVDPWNALGREVKDYSDNNFRLVRGEEVSVSDRPVETGIHQQHLLVFGKEFSKCIPGAFSRVRFAEIKERMLSHSQSLSRDALRMPTAEMKPSRNVLDDLWETLWALWDWFEWLWHRVRKPKELIDYFDYLFGEIYTLVEVLTGKSENGDPVPELESRFVKLQNALAFAAHPTSAPKILGGTMDFTWDDDDLNQPIHGVQAWNTRIRWNSLETYNPFDTWESFDGKAEEDKAIQWWDEELRRRADAGEGGLVLLAGSDAHGSFNYTAGIRLSLPELGYTGANDNSLGKVRTLLYLPRRTAGDALTDKDIVDAILSGCCVVTDGPVLNFTAHFHDQEAKLGEVLEVSGDGNVEVNVQATSTDEFGHPEDVKVFFYFPGIPERKETVVNYRTKQEIDEDIEAQPGIGYVRLETETNNGKETFRCATNPIWIQFRSPGSRKLKVKCIDWTDSV